MKGFNINERVHSQSFIEIQTGMSGLNEGRIVFKPMTYEELRISFERLQRFNNPYKKFERVYRDILFKHLIFPKLSLKTYSELNLGTIKYLVQLIWNKSVIGIKPDCNENNLINRYLLYEELKERSAKEILKKFIFSANISGFTKPANFCDSEFISDENILRNIFEQNGINFDDKFEDLSSPDALSGIYIVLGMNYPLNTDGFLQIAEARNENSVNIRRLILINKLIKNDETLSSSPKLWEIQKKIYEAAEIYRNDYGLKKPLKLVILAEGATEEILLPVFSSVAGVNFDKNGIEIIDSGGKNHVARIYSEIRNELNIPVLIILDSDAHEVADSIRKELRPQDGLYLISEGEFEDILPDKLICKAVNSYYGLAGRIEMSEINTRRRKTAVLTEVWRQKGFGDFKKAEFARIIALHVTSSDDLSEEMQKIISRIKKCNG